MRERSYWEKRARAMEARAERSARAVVRDVGTASLRATRALSEAAERIRKKYQTAFGLSEEAARAALRQPCGRAEYDELMRMIAGMPKGAARTALEARAASGAYSYRMTRAEALGAEIEAQTGIVAQVTQQALRERMTDAVRDGFRRTVFDVQRGSGFGFSFHDMQRDAIAAVVAKPWSGVHFSKRVWKNREALGAALNEEITAALMAGKGSRSIAEAISQRMQVGMASAARLARTELHYAQNAGGIAGMREAGIERFRFLAALDGRTSEICRDMDGREFDVADAQIGVNMPPMHPNCRSTFVTVEDAEWEDGATRRSVDPETGTVRRVPAEMTYREWEKELAREREEQGGLTGACRKAANNGVFSSLPERMSKKHIRAIAKEYGIDLKGLTLVIDADPEKLQPTFGVAGRADYITVGRIDFFPLAFRSKEELTRTLVHERIHVEQFRAYGVETVLNNSSRYEKLAIDSENRFIERLRKEGHI